MNKKRVLYKRITVFALALSMLFCFTACGRQDGVGGNDDGKKESVYSVYAVSKEGTHVAIACEYEPDDEEYGDVKKSLQHLFAFLKTQPEDVSLCPAISDKVVLDKYSYSDNTVKLYFENSYRELDRGTEVLTRAAIVRTLCQVPGVDYVEFSVGNDPLMDAGGAVAGAMSPDMFIDNPGNEINGYEQINLTLYLVGEDGESLREVHRECVYNSNISADKLVVEEIIKGPGENDEGLMPSVSPLTKVVSVTTNDFTCYVNLDSGFLVKQEGVSPEAAIYSIVNSLCELSNVNRVQISVDGNSEVLFMEKIPLSQTFERNLEIMNAR